MIFLRLKKSIKSYNTIIKNPSYYSLSKHIPSTTFISPLHFGHMFLDKTYFGISLLQLGQRYLLGEWKFLLKSTIWQSSFKSDDLMNGFRIVLEILFSFASFSINAMAFSSSYGFLNDEIMYSLIFLSQLAQ